MIVLPKLRITIAGTMLTLMTLVMSEETVLAVDGSATAVPILANTAAFQNEDSNTDNRIDNLTRQIILREIELEKFNVHYKMEVGKQGRWAGWRYATFQESNYCLNLAAGIVNTSERTSHFTNPERLGTHKLADANLTSMVGYIIGSASGALELAITEYHDLRASRLGFSPEVAMKHVLALKNEIDKLLLERESLISIEQGTPLLHSHAEIDVIEGKVLRDLLDLTLLEYQKFHISARRFVAFQKSLYFFDMSKYAIASAGSFFAYMAQHKHDRKWNIKAGIMFDISGALIIATPYVSRGIGILTQKWQRHITSSIVADVKTDRLAILEADEAALEKAYREKETLSRSCDRQFKRVIVYHEENDHFQNVLEQAVKQERAGKLTATQNIMTGTFTGACHLTNGILYTVVGEIAHGKTPRDARVSNYNLAAGAITNLPGNALAIADTLRIQVRAELLRHKQAKVGKLPSQLLQRRLAQLNQMTEDLNAPAARL